MQSDNEYFLCFIKLLIKNKILTMIEVQQALEDLDGVKGVIADQLYISAHEELARFITKKLNYDEQLNFLSQFKGSLTENRKVRIFFAWAFIDQLDLTVGQRTKLINFTPEIYHDYLIDRFL